MPELKAIGLLGGTFDPIHFGHLRSALEIQQTLDLTEMRIVPCQEPPHRNKPQASSAHRLNMAKLAVLGSKLTVDDQEMRRVGPSYSINTLMSIRSLFPSASICMLVGSDAFASLPSWHQWERLGELANIVVMCRAGYTLPERGVLPDFIQKNALQPGEALTSFTCGRISMQNITNLEISASNIRAMLAKSQSPHFLLPEKVLEYIQNNRLYAPTNDSNTEEEVKTL